jgi:hypothetical protein
MIDGSSAVWRRSERCDQQNHCVEVACVDGAVRLRNSRRPDAQVPLTARYWNSFVISVKAGEFDLPD